MPPPSPMPINWFPGHMLTAIKEAAETMGRTDLVIEVLDARAPHASCNPQVEKLRLVNGRPALKLLNKSDLADPVQTSAWLKFYNDQAGVKAIALSAKKQSEIGRILKEAKALVPTRGAAAKPLRMMILGIPNVGKSTLMNALLKRQVATVGDKPAITKMQMGHALGPGMWLIDTPGFLWAGLGLREAYLLAAINSIGRGAYDEQNVAARLGSTLLSHYRELLTHRYGEIPPTCDGAGLIAWVAQHRSLILKGGVADLNRASAVLLDEYRSGLLGRTTLERTEAEKEENDENEEPAPAPKEVR